jgi:phosphocarrier protein
VGKPGEMAVNASSLLSVLALGVKCGDTVEINVADEDGADAVLAHLVEIVSTDHDE